MQKKEVDHFERHPKVVLITDNVEECLGVSEVIKSNIEAFRVLIKPADIYQVLIDAKPIVILFAYQQIAKSVELYAELIKKNLFSYRHQTIVLCDNKESGVAFRCCFKKIFNNYFVHKPMYENFRLRLILQNMLSQQQGEAEIIQIQEKHFGKIDDNIIKLINEVAAQHTQCLENIAHTKQLALDKINDESDPLAADSTLLEILRSEYLDPLITTLESQLSHNIVDILDKLKKSRESIQSCQTELTSYQQTNQAQHEDLLALLAEQTHELKTDNTNINDEVTSIMVVDDNEIYREMICKVLRESGFKAIGFESGTDAINALKKHRYHAVFMDLFMPGLDGYNTTKNIRQLQGYEKLPIVALTSNRDKELIRKWAQCGLVGYIAKPATKQSILSALEKAAIHAPNK